MLFTIVILTFSFQAVVSMMPVVKSLKPFYLHERRIQRLGCNFHRTKTTKRQNRFTFNFLKDTIVGTACQRLYLLRMNGNLHLASDLTDSF